MSNELQIILINKEYVNPFLLMSTAYVIQSNLLHLLIVVFRICYVLYLLWVRTFYLHRKFTNNFLIDLNKMYFIGTILSAG